LQEVISQYRTARGYEKTDTLHSNLNMLREQGVCTFYQ